MGEKMSLSRSFETGKEEVQYVFAKAVTIQ
jgi:hypothetical protein